MIKINCPFCGKELIQLNLDTRGPTYVNYYEFWCDECYIDISIGTDNEKLEEVD